MFNMGHVQVVTLPCKIDAGSGLVPNIIEGGSDDVKKQSKSEVTFEY